MAGVKFCPLCGDEFDSDQDMCPRDGRLLMEEQNGEGPGVQLSSATERLLGNILDDDDTIRVGRRRRRRRHAADDEAETQIGPPPIVEEVILGPAPGFEDNVTETTVSTSVDPPQEATLGSPLASLSLDQTSTDETLDEDLGQNFVKRPSSGPARVFSDLQLEFDQLDTEIDDEVTQRVARQDDEKTRRSEMPPEFLEVLEREEGELRSGPQEPPSGPSEKVEIEESLGEELSKLEDDEPPAPKRPLPRPSELHVQKMVIQIGRPKPRRWVWAAIIALVVFVVTLLVAL